MKLAAMLLAVILVVLSLTFTEAADTQKPTGQPPKSFSARLHRFRGTLPPGFTGTPPPGFSGKPKTKSA
ncbi:hypothetical protein OESDEN_05412 [Oesophagostomum dentatum]|uniref:Uncharacterized protein n=1 Tax=Oesophagostomum dentatum TaxID=61180 RepID=A0A0B1TBP3_OESDE|nr:hypothetical protein OESDEN_05412 [Oesophagostomum dentatum]